MPQLLRQIHRHTLAHVEMLNLSYGIPTTQLKQRRLVHPLTHSLTPRKTCPHPSTAHSQAYSYSQSGGIARRSVHLYSTHRKREQLSKGHSCIRMMYSSSITEEHGPSKQSALDCNKVRRKCQEHTFGGRHLIIFQSSETSHDIPRESSKGK